jgi:putative ABC transport system substrate-binding protein
LLVAATQTIPIVLGSSSEILARGWAKSFAQPGGNVTGILNIGPELGPKRLQLLKQALPKAMKIGVLVYSPGAQTLRELNLIEQSSKELRVAIVSASTKIPVDLENAFSTFAKNRVDAVVSTHSVFFQTESAYLVSLSAIHRIPFIAHRSDMAEQGALFSYGSVIEEQFRRAAHLIDKVLRGAKPGDLPVEQPSIFELVINRRTARMLGIGIPDSLLLQATRVIQ